MGKSVLLKSLNQALIKYFNSKAGENPDFQKVLLSAPTGKAAHNIGGNTIHSTFAIPVGKGFDFKPLDMQQLDSMRCKFFSLKVIFIDEISMVGKQMFNFINLKGFKK
jgi:ATP-dependent exoDNAse (exonuclease V) alpha subunit